MEVIKFMKLLLRELSVGCKSSSKSSSEDMCNAQLTLVSITPAYHKQISVFYRFGLMNADGAIDFLMPVVSASSSDLVLFNHQKHELFTKGWLMANRTRYVNDYVVIIVCEVSVQRVLNRRLIIRNLIDYRSTPETKSKSLNHLRITWSDCLKTEFLQTWLSPLLITKLLQHIKLFSPSRRSSSRCSRTKCRRSTQAWSTSKTSLIAWFTSWLIFYTRRSSSSWMA